MEKIHAHIIQETISSNSSQAHSLYEKSRFGEKKIGKIVFSFSECLYLLEKKKMELFSKNKSLSFEETLNKLSRMDKKIQLKYAVYKDLREKGYIVKTALKFGADFRVYDKSNKPGKSHSKWIVFVDHEGNKTTWNEISAKNRVAHSTKKKLLLAIVDEEKDILYYEMNWIKP